MGVCRWWPRASACFGADAGVPVVGVLLLVGVTVTVAAAPLVLLKVGQGGQDPIVTGVASRIAAGSGGWGDGDEVVEVVHRAGRVMEASSVQVVVTIDGARTLVPGTAGSADGETFASAGSPWRHTTTIPAGAEVSVEVHWERLMTEQLVAQDVHLAPGTAVVPGNGNGNGNGGGNGGGGGDVTLCHFPPGHPEQAHTLVVGAGAVDAHLGHGDHLGPCAEEEGAGADEGHDHGDGEGEGEGDGDGDGAAGPVTICHIPPGNPGNARTLQVPESALPGHLGHGDTLGACPDG